MTVQIDILNLIILVVVIVIAAFLLPLIWQLKKTARETDALLHDLRRELIPSLQDFREITERINRASAKIETGSGHTENLLESLDEIFTSIRQVNRFFRQDACHLAENAACLIMGIRAAGKVFFNETREKGE
jgi:uncharacterized protein YoxC